MDSEKIKKGLECCSLLIDNTKTGEEQDNSCNECPYRVNDRCSWKLDSDALNYIKDLEQKNRQLYNSGQNKNTTCLGLMRDNERLSDIVQRQQGEVKAYKDVIDNYFKKGLVLCDGTMLEETKESVEEDIEREKHCKECQDQTLTMFAHWLSKKTGDYSYMRLLEEFKEKILV